MGSSEVMLILNDAVVNASIAKLDARCFASIVAPFKPPTFSANFSKIFFGENFVDEILFKTQYLSIWLLQ